MFEELGNSSQPESAALKSSKQLSRYREELEQYVNFDIMGEPRTEPTVDCIVTPNIELDDQRREITEEHESRLE